jgi:hypothetical protein
MIHISIRTIPHTMQRYDTVGDWQYQQTDGALIIRVSDMNNWRYELLVGIHELVEATLCSIGGISQEAVDKFDLAYQGDGEPGDEPNCPYHGPHQIATGVERILAGIMGVVWTAYEEAIADLPEWKPQESST